MQREVDPASPRVGLVLGGGGFPAMAFHAGTLLALHLDVGWTVADAEVVVGTSAGSVIGALACAGMSSDDLAAWSAEAASMPDRGHLRRPIDGVERVGLRTRLPHVRHRFRTDGWWSVPLALLNFGVIDGSRALDEITGLFDEWPDALRIATVRARDGSRRVFGPSDGVPVVAAIAASCAIPALFRPVLVQGDLYVDGGVHSPTNADLLIGAGVDVALVLSPMTGDRAGPRGTPAWALRRSARRRLDGEVRGLEAAGIETIVFEPDRATLRAAGWNMLSRDRTGRVSQQAFLSAFRHADAAAVARVRDLLRRRAVG